MMMLMTVRESREKDTRANVENGWARKKEKKKKKDKTDAATSSEDMQILIRLLRFSVPFAWFQM